MDGMYRWVTGAGVCMSVLLRVFVEVFACVVVCLSARGGVCLLASPAIYEDARLPVSMHMFSFPYICIRVRVFHVTVRQSCRRHLESVMS